MRIISGIYKSHHLESPNGFKTHPMGDRIKVALFNTIQTQVAEARVLDAYAGSGALGLEALSRGAKYVQFIEQDFKAYKVIQQNIDNLGIPSKQYKLTRANCGSWSLNNESDKFDLIFADPPFEQLNLSTINQLVKHLSEEGLMVLSHTGRETVPTVNKVVVVDNRMYGDAALSYYRKV